MARQSTKAQLIREQPHFVKSLERGLAVIRAFGHDHVDMTVSDVAEATGMTRAAARRFLLTLVDLRYVSTNGKSFSLTPRVLELGYSFMSTLSMSELARPYMSALVETINRGSSIAVLDGFESVNVGRVESSGFVRVTVPLGTRLPAFCNSMGRVLLAALPPDELDAYIAAADFPAYTRRTVTDQAQLRRVLGRVRANGYAIVNQEFEELLVAIAVPLRNVEDQVIAAMNVSLQAFRIDMAYMQNVLLPPLLHAAAQITDALRVSSTLSRT